MKIEAIENIINIPAGEVNLTGNLVIPENAKSIIIFSHGSGSSRLSPRNYYVARKLQNGGFATLLFDLLTEEEDLDYEMRFNIPLLTERLERVAHWVVEHPVTEGFDIGFFGASTGAASALAAAANLHGTVKAVVSRGGRPDLAMQELLEVETPTLLIVGSLDKNVINFNRSALRHLAGDRKLTIVQGATHFFGELGKLEEVAQLATNWFKKYLR